MSTLGMIRKALLILTALAMVVSGVAAVSAFEAHIVNVKGHVENAMAVDATHINFGQYGQFGQFVGSVFPEEWLVKHFTVGISTSFCNPNQLRHKKVFYQVLVDRKPNPAGGFFPWLGDALYLAVDLSGPALATNPHLTPVGTGAPPVLMTLFDVNTGTFYTT
ncbi:MAG: hypothetical protein AAB037_03440, partial [Chloroflexota bacterium]